MGLDYSYLRLLQKNGKLTVSQITCSDADKGGEEKESELLPISSNTVYLRVEVKTGANCSFSYSENGEKFKPIGQVFTVREGKWIGAKIGFFALREGIINNSGQVDIDWFRIEK